MSNLILLLVAAAWAAVLVPPLVQSRLRNSPTSSVSNFRRQLSSLQRDTRPIPRGAPGQLAPLRSEEHTSELQSH